MPPQQPRTEHGSSTPDRFFLQVEPGPAATDPHAAQHLELQPSPALRPFVTSVGVCREHVGSKAITERVLPDGCVHLLFNFGDAPQELGVGGWPAQLAGAGATPSTVLMSGTVDGLSVALRAGAVSAVLGVPAGAVAGQGLPLDALWGRAASELLERLAQATTSAARIRLLERALLQRVMAGGGAVDPAAAGALRLIHEARGGIRVREVADRLGLSQRRLEQLFHQHVGITPKLVCRLARFHAGIAAIRQQPARPWSHIALDAGYYDQSHMINEFRAVAGVTPTEFIRHRVSGFSKTA